MPVEAADVTAFVRVSRVKEISGLAKSTLMRWIKAGKFPAPVIQDGNSVLWDLAECLEWRAEQFLKREARQQTTVERTAAILERNQHGIESNAAGGRVRPPDPQE